MDTQPSLFSDEITLSPEWQDFVDQQVELMKLDVVQGLAFEKDPEAFKAVNIKKQPAKVGALVADHLKSLPAGGKRRRPDYKNDIPLDLVYNSEIRSLARKHNVDLASKRSVLDQVKPEAFSYVTRELVDEARIKRLHSNLFTTMASEPAEAVPMRALTTLLPIRHTIDPAILRLIAERIGGGSSAPPAVHNRGLKFRINQVRCIDETNPEWPGSDEIGMGGTAIADDGTTSKISEFFVGGGFDDGDRKTYSPPRVLHTFSLDNVDYPGDFSVIVALAEKDNGGLSKFIDELWKKIKDHVQIILTALGAAAGAAAGTAIGGTLGTAIGGPLGTIIGAVAGAIVGALVGWLISALKDDIFTPKVAAVRLPQPDSTFENGALVSPTLSLNYRDHGGYYRVYYSWQIVR